jgi:hypothetical protein
MRTTITLESDVERLINQAVHKSHKSFKDVVNEAIRLGLSRFGKTEQVKPFKVKPFNLGLRPGIDPARFNQLVDEMEDQAFVSKLRKQ